MINRNLQDIFRDSDKTVTGFESEGDHKVELDDMILARNIGDVLHKHYPGHLWATNVNSEQGVAVIYNWRVSHTHGYLFKLKDLTPFDSAVVRKVLMAGGEILERAYMNRGKANGQYAKKVDGTGDKGRKIIV